MPAAARAATSGTTASGRPNRRAQCAAALPPLLRPLGACVVTEPQPALAARPGRRLVAAAAKLLAAAAPASTAKMKSGGGVLLVSLLQARAPWLLACLPRTARRAAATTLTHTRCGSQMIVGLVLLGIYEGYKAR